MSSAVISQFDWAKELEQTVVKSLTTTFGLDFLLLEDKKGGDVDTIHKAREYQKDLKENGSSDIYVSEQLAGQLDSQGNNVDPYKKERVTENGTTVKEDPYHTDKRFRDKAKADKKARQEGKLKDKYAKGEQPVSPDTQTQLDHVISSNEIHNDAGRILSGVDSVELSVAESNLASTHYYVNNRKSDMTMEEFVNKEVPKILENKKVSVAEKEENLKTMPENTPEEKHKKRQLEDSIRKEKEHIEALENIDKEKMIEADRKAREEYNKKINSTYYKSSKFLKAAGSAAHKKGLQMGTRQALGLVLGEVWFELREQVPAIYQRHKVGFDLEKFWVDIQETLKNIFLRVKARFKDLLTTFKDSYIGGVLASINETVLNAFFITQKMIGKMIREMWNNLVGIIKLVFFNPNNLAMGELLKEAMKLLALSVASLVGTALNNYLNGLLVFPYGGLAASFISALVTGILNLGFTYFLEHSAVMQKVWDYLNQIKSKYAKMVDRMKEINLELDRYLMELAKIELNFNVEELTVFANQLCAANGEAERSAILLQEVTRRNIELPFEAGNADSGRKWLLKLQSNYHNKN